MTKNERKKLNSSIDLLRSKFQELDIGFNRIYAKYGACRKIEDKDFVLLLYSPLCECFRIIDDVDDFFGGNEE